ncbi:hypothetical protein [Stenotrophomonas hibiscicola]|uniref:hypothetical protein n=1 Tax=Stenotrophomonas hibiscicola TaxID=86189 RepID=UPI002E776F83|nr:hypothetical protein [[Pseudomonas] hibiscicola]
MSWWNAISTCWTPGQHGCVVWWDAWAVVAAFTAVIATVFLGLMTLGLGLAANKASAAAVRIASAEAKSRETTAKDERHMLLMWIGSEITLVDEQLHYLANRMEGPFAKSLFGMEVSFRMTIADGVEAVQFVTTKSRDERLHVLGHPLAGRLARAIGLCDLIKGGFRQACLTTPEVAADAWDKLDRVLPMLRSDIEFVKLACFQAAKEIGITGNPFDPAMLKEGAYIAG